MTHSNPPNPSSGDETPATSPAHPIPSDDSSPTSNVKVETIEELREAPVAPIDATLQGDNIHTLEDLGRQIEQFELRRSSATFDPGKAGHPLNSLRRDEHFRFDTRPLSASERQLQFLAAQVENLQQRLHVLERHLTRTQLRTWEMQQRQSRLFHALLGTASGEESAAEESLRCPDLRALREELQARHPDSPPSPVMGIDPEQLTSDLSTCRAGLVSWTRLLDGVFNAADDEVPRERTIPVEVLEHFHRTYRHVRAALRLATEVFQHCAPEQALQLQTELNAIPEDSLIGARLNTLRQLLVDWDRLARALPFPGHL